MHRVLPPAPCDKPPHPFLLCGRRDKQRHFRSADHPCPEGQNQLPMYQFRHSPGSFQVLCIFSFRPTQLRRVPRYPTPSHRPVSAFHSGNGKLPREPFSHLPYAREYAFRWMLLYQLLNNIFSYPSSIFCL